MVSGLNPIRIGLVELRIFISHAVYMVWEFYSVGFRDSLRGIWLRLVKFGPGRVVAWLRFAVFGPGQPAAWLRFVDLGSSISGISGVIR